MSHSSAPAAFSERQRVLICWERHRVGEHSEYAGRVIEVTGDFIKGRGFVQTRIRVEYEHTGYRWWHKPTELSPLEEGAVVAPPPADDASEDEAEADEALPKKRPRGKAQCSVPATAARACSGADAANEEAAAQNAGREMEDDVEEQAEGTEEDLGNAPGPVGIVATAHGYHLHTCETSPTGYIGVAEVGGGRFEASVGHGSQRKGLGIHGSAVEAAVAYARHVRSLDGLAYARAQARPSPRSPKPTRRDAQDGTEALWSCGNAPEDPPEGFAYAPCPSLDTEEQHHELLGARVLVAHERTESFDAGWYMGRIKLFGVSAAWKRACPSANFIVRFRRGETNSALHGDEGLELTVHNYGRNEWWLLLEPR